MQYFGKKEKSYNGVVENGTGLHFLPKLENAFKMKLTGVLNICPMFAGGAEIVLKFVNSFCKLVYAFSLHFGFN